MSARSRSTAGTPTINEGVVNGRLAQLLGALDAALGAVETNMGAAWSETVVTLITEFGRTARINGTAGTDHGTATVALLLGGALKGGRVVADWPGVKEADLYEKRDLKATTDLRAVLKGLLRDHLRVDERVLTADIFPGSDDCRADDRIAGVAIGRIDREFRKMCRFLWSWTAVPTEKSAF